MIKKYLVSIDPSKRSTGLHIFNTDTLKPVLCAIIDTRKIEYDEDIMIDIINHIFKYTNSIIGKEKNIDFAIEGLSFNALSGERDFIDGLHWFIRVMIRMNFPKSNIGIIPVMSWRNKLSTKKERKEAKEKWKKNALKEMMVEKLEFDMKEKFLSIIKSNCYKKESIYDLSDSYWIGIYRMFLEENENFLK